MSEVPTSQIVLCIDDHTSSLVLRRIILENAGFSVLTAETATAGLALLRQSQVNLAIVDYFLPDMDGTALATEIKALRPELKVLMLSGTIEEPGMRSIDAFLTKGGTTKEFLQVVHKLIG